MTSEKKKTKCSLLVLAFNQENFIAEAIRAALAQTYSPLEIIISDDASTDQTFSVIKNNIRDYVGPHEIILNRNNENMGVVAHTNAIVSRATGEILIPAYGDDISYPDRVKRIMHCFETEDPLLVHSLADPIDSMGKPTNSQYLKADFFRTTDTLEIATSLFHYLGASGAWSRSLFNAYGPLQSPLIYDDHILGFRASLEGRVSLIKEPLLAYREGVGISQAPKKNLSYEQYRKQRKKILHQALSVIKDRRNDAIKFGLMVDNPIIRKLSVEIITKEIRLSYYEGLLLSQILEHPLLASFNLLKETIRNLQKK